jgi:hypothetical protein
MQNRRARYFISIESGSRLSIWDVSAVPKKQRPALAAVRNGVGARPVLPPLMAPGAPFRPANGGTTCGIAPNAVCIGSGSNKGYRQTS